MPHVRYHSCRHDPMARLIAFRSFSSDHILMANKALIFKLISITAQAWPDGGKSADSFSQQR
jgi:hypothetical protein